MLKPFGLTAAVVIAGLIVGACSNPGGRARVAGEAMSVAWTPPDPERPVLSDRAAVSRCEGLGETMERAVHEMTMCTMAINASPGSGFDKEDIKRYCGNATVRTDLALRAWADVTSAPQTSIVRACREDLHGLGEQLVRADAYQRQLMLYATDPAAAEPPSYFLRNPPPSYPAPKG